MAVPPARYGAAVWVGSGVGSLSFEEALLFRREFIPESSCLHFAKSPVCLERGRGQYLYDDKDRRYLDCFSSSCPVGHCHPDIVATGRKVLSHFLTRSMGDFREAPLREPKRKALRRAVEDNGVAEDISNMLSDFMARLRKHLPPQYNTFYFAKSGSEANDIALFIARKFTGGSETLVIDQSHHGDLSSIAAVSARMFRRHKQLPESWVHILPLPDEDNPHELFFSAKSMINDLKEHGRKLCCLLCEPVFGLAGIFTPPRDAFHDIVTLVRDNGGLWIADEILTGLGRLGSHFWGFEVLNCGGGRTPVYPDILTVGKPLGNGFPISLIITTKEIAQPSADTLEPLSRPPLEGAIGATVLRVMDDDRLMQSAGNVGWLLKTQLSKLARRHSILGNVRGQGLLMCVDIVTGKGSRHRNKVDALHLWYLLKDRRVLCALEGPDRSALVLLPPLCFNEGDALDFVQALSESVDALNMLSGPAPEITNGGSQYASYLRHNVEDADDVDRIPNGPQNGPTGYSADFGSLD